MGGESRRQIAIMMQQMDVQDLKSVLSPPGQAGARTSDADDIGALEVWLAFPEAASHVDAERLSPPQRQKLARLRTSAKRQDFVVSRALQQHVTGRASQSLTHSGGHAAVAFAPAGTRVGVDLERHRPRDVETLARFAFSEEEHAELMSLAAQRRMERFYTLWVMKEALAKALQLPLLEALRRCTFTASVPAQWRGSAPTLQRWRVRAFQPHENFSLAVALVGDDLPGTLDAFEWPPRRQAQWRPTASVEGQGSSDLPTSQSSHAAVAGHARVEADEPQATAVASTLRARAAAPAA
jgi:4'-phosphopantetheinyl transferase